MVRLVTQIIILLKVSNAPKAPPSPPINIMAALYVGSVFTTMFLFTKYNIIHQYDRYLHWNIISYRCYTTLLPVHVEKVTLDLYIIDVLILALLPIVNIIT